jgi:hypothetical protein
MKVQNFEEAVTSIQQILDKDAEHPEAKALMIKAKK